jgi:hypothetical protein
MLESEEVLAWLVPVPESCALFSARCASFCQRRDDGVALCGWARAGTIILEDSKFVSLARHKCLYEYRYRKSTYSSLRLDPSRNARWGADDSTYAYSSIHSFETFFFFPGFGELMLVHDRGSQYEQTSTDIIFILGFFYYKS